MKAKTKPPSKSKSAKRQAALGVVTKVLHIRLKDKHASFLLAQSREVNQVWNYSQDLALKVLERERRFISAFDIAAYTKGASKEGLSLHSLTVQAVSKEYCTRRKQFKKHKLRWRISRGAKRSLGWIPVKSSALAYKGGQVHYQGQPLSLWDSYGLADYELRQGSFCEDSRGRWYLNVSVDVKKPAPGLGTNAIGIDLGLKDLASVSDGSKVEIQKTYRNAETALVVAQRANKKARVKAIHAKIANRRKDFSHKLSTRMVRANGAIFVGNVNAGSLAKTSMAKSVLDASWSTFRTMLQYKCDHAGVWFDEVNESYSTQECSECHARTGPKGLTGLGVREWTCSVCGSIHDRDTNAAKNILERGLVGMRVSLAMEAKANDIVMNKAVSASTTDGVGHDPLAVGITALPAQAAAVG